MSLDRVIQDSDEDEPFEGDAPSVSMDPLHPSEPILQQQHHEVPAKQLTHYTMHEHGHATEESMFPQLNVNFDEFLQSQERGHAMISSSQQRLEDKWIPSASEGGSGSVGAMMAEIGIAQRRLLDEDPSSAGVQFPNTAAMYSMDSIESAPFPTMPSSHEHQMDQAESDNLAYARAHDGVYVDANQPLLSTRQDIYDLTPPETTTNSMASPPKIIPQQFVEPLMHQENAQLNPFPKALQYDFHQIGPHSSHDTEPFSSVASMAFNGARPELAETNIIPQNSQASTHDELALPAAIPTVDVSVAKKKRGRPKKQSFPQDDEDDELANSRDHEFKHSGANGAIDPSDNEETTENNTPASSGVSAETNEQNLDSTPKPVKPNAKESKKKKPKKAKATPIPDPDNDDVIWVDTRPLDVQTPTENATPQTETPETTATDTSPTTLTSNPSDDPKPPTPAPVIEENTQAENEKPPPKKRGRKRKQPPEQVQTPTEDTDTPEPNNPVEAKTPAPKLAVIVDNSPKSIPDANQSVENDPSAIQNPEQNGNGNSAPDINVPATTSDEPPPQTPSKPDAASVITPRNTGKGPDKHSPISARSAVPYRVGLSKRARIAPLLKIVRK
ncbi:hypothetical protein N7457_004858 [Penicillium paradoxum]|uniref:uncharacterized protein n=1 Tax=Penicillium paradoxum TaxID=176176 RepID=UPI00254681EF|nr:uncharacterized protein N7457_004858 [Penicillium paradoxum]KAJ5783084.1 hypothetical protein N7457_004858 [Penicillium paradoxum]